MVESRQNAQRFFARTLNVALVGRNLNECRTDRIELACISARQTGEGGTASFERTICVATYRQQPRADVNAVTEQGGKDCIAADAAIGATRDSQQEVSGLGWTHVAEI